MKKIIISLLSIILVCATVSSCGGSCKSGGEGGQTVSSTAASTPLESPTATKAPETTAESTAPESTAPETTLPETDSNFHYHDFNEIWLTDEEFHWHKCNLCIGTTKKEPHTIGVEAVLREPTESRAGQAVFSCKTCGYSYIGEIPYAPNESK